MSLVSPFDISKELRGRHLENGQTPQYTLPRQSRNNSGILQLGSWNVRTMCPGVVFCDLMKDKMPVYHPPDMPCFYCDHLCHSAISKVSYECACLAKMAIEISTNP
jgi:hypothetical protein